MSKTATKSKPKAAKPTSAKSATRTSKDKPQKSKPMSAANKAAHLDDKIIELEGVQRLYGQSVLEWEEAHSHAGELKKTMEKNQARLNSVAQDIVDIRSGNYTPPLPFPADAPPAKGKGAKAHEANGHAANGAVDPAIDMPILALARYGLTENKCDVLAEARLETIGKLEKQMRNVPWWHREITGIGVDGVDKITDALLAFRKEHPVPEAPAPEPTAPEASANGEATSEAAK